MVKRYDLKKINWDEYDTENPFIKWYASLFKRNAAKMDDKGNIMLEPMASKRFAIGIDEDGITPLFGIPDEEREAVLSIPWSNAAFVRNHKERDWIILASNKFNDKDMKIKLWFPAIEGLLAGWENRNLTPQQEEFKNDILDPVRLIMVSIEFRKGKPHKTGGEILHLPLTLKGFNDKSNSKVLKTNDVKSVEKKAISNSSVVQKIENKSDKNSFLEFKKK